MKSRLRFSVLLVPLLLALPPMVLASKVPKDGPPAPMPAQIAAARKIFIANAPGDPPGWADAGPSRAYNQLYAALKTWGHYELVSAPADADLVFEISATYSLIAVNGTSTTGCSSASSSDLLLVILDPKTGVPLWWFKEPVEFRRHISDPFDDAVDRLMTDMKKMGGEAPSPSADVKK